MSKTKWGIRFQEYKILYYYIAGPKIALHKKVILDPKNVFLCNFQLFEDCFL